MTKKLSFLSLGLMILMLGMLMSGGCSGAISEYNYYYYPNWMPDGRIICSKVHEKQKEVAPGVVERIERKYYVTAMNDDGANEQNLFEISSEIKEITCSPTGELIAYITTADGGITTSNYAGTNKIVLPGISGAEYLDWSPNALKIVYSNSSRELHVVNSDGANDALISSEASGPVSWRVGTVISYGYLYTINSDGTNNNKLVAGAYPQNYSASEVVYVGSGGAYKIGFDGSGNTKLFSNYDKATLKLSFDNTKIVGGDFDQTGIKGVYIINIDGTGGKQLR